MATHDRIDPQRDRHPNGQDRASPRIRRKCRGGREEIYLIEFARRWAAFGGPSDEDILVQFGIDRVEFTHRLARTVNEFLWEAETVRQIVGAYLVPAAPSADGPRHSPLDP